jgi:hypothetical protein
LICRGRLGCVAMPRAATRSITRIKIIRISRVSRGRLRLLICRSGILDADTLRDRHATYPPRVRTRATQPAVARRERWDDGVLHRRRMDNQCLATDQPETTNVSSSEQTE